MAVPASAIVSVSSSVLSPGGTGLDFASMFLTTNTNVPIGAPVNFANAQAVLNYFGASSQEYALSLVYFQGFDSSNIKPGQLWFTQYPTAPVAAYLRGLPAPTLANVQLILPGVTTSASTIALTTLTVSAMSSGTLVPGMLLTGTGVTAGTRIVSQLTGTTGGAGTYQVSISQTVAATAITGAYDLNVTIDGTLKTAASLNLSAATSLSNAATLIATALTLSGGQTCTYSSQFNAFVITSGTTGLTSTITLGTGQGGTALGLNTGATLSQGAVAVTNPGAFMTALTGFTSDWVSFVPLWATSSGDKQNLATWASAQGTRYVAIINDTDATILQSPSAFVGFGNWLATNSVSGTFPVYNDLNTCAMVAGLIASIDFTQRNGRVTAKFKTNSVMPGPIVTDLTSYTNMVANGYSAYVQFAVQQSQSMLADGAISGPFKWLDSYVGAIRLAVSLQNDMVSLLQQQKSIPYNNQGYALITAAAMDAINDSLNFGTIRPNTPPSSSEAAQMNAAAGLAIDLIVGARGWYFQVLPASATIRAARQSPPVTLWYMDGESIQKINLAAVDVL